MDNLFLRYLTFVMLYTGTMPLQMVKYKNLKKSMYAFYRNAVQASSLVFLILLCAKIPYLVEDRSAFLEGLNVLFIYIAMCIKVAVCLSTRMGHLIYEMVKFEKSIRTSNNKKVLEIYQYTVQRVRLVQWFYIIQIYSILVPFLLTPFVKNYVLWDESKYNSSSVVVRPLPHNFWLPFDQTKHYLTGFSLSFYCCILSMNYYCYTQSMFVILPSYASFRLKLLKNYIKNNKQYSRELFDFQEDDDNYAENILRFCIKEHISIIRTVTNLNEALKNLMLLEFLLSSIQISSVLFQIISTESTDILIFSLCYFMVLMAQSYILYWHADDIRVQSVAVSTALYEIEWYKYDRNLTLTIQIMMIRAQRPLSITVGPFGEMSMEMAAKIYKAAYTYVTFLRQTYGDKLK